MCLYTIYLYTCVYIYIYIYIYWYVFMYPMESEPPTPTPEISQVGVSNESCLISHFPNWLSGALLGVGGFDFIG